MVAKRYCRAVDNINHWPPIIGHFTFKEIRAWPCDGAPPLRLARVPQAPRGELQLALAPVLLRPAMLCCLRK
ncbi:unnamed protein product [Leptosia nina]|uniref:Uncharacterized protein n=1 Tax=Leptosia nina TaxID=320188 RepID=A0AAV1JAV1_9NEOP